MSRVHRKDESSDHRNFKVFFVYDYIQLYFMKNFYF